MNKLENTISTIVKTIVSKNDIDLNTNLFNTRLIDFEMKELIALELEKRFDIVLYYEHLIDEYFKSVKSISLLVQERIDKKNKRKELLNKGVICIVKSVDEYRSLIREFKQLKIKKKYKTAVVYLEEIKRLIDLKMLYYIKLNRGIIFLNDQDTFYRSYLYADLDVLLQVPRLDKDILIEYVYSNDDNLSKLKVEDDFLCGGNFIFNKQYRSFYPGDGSEYENIKKKNIVLKKVMESEGLCISVPHKKMLPEFEFLFKQEIEKYTQSVYTRAERRVQLKENQLMAMYDSCFNIYSISIDSSIYGGAIATKKEYQKNFYAGALLFYIYEKMYEGNNIFNGMQNFKNKKYAGWISDDNFASHRIFNLLNIEYSNKFMREYVLPAID